MLSDAGRKYLRVHLTPDVGPIRFRNLLDHFGDVDAIFGASMAELERVEGIGPKIARSIFEARTDTLVDEEIQRAAALGVRICCWADADYPRPLLNITDPPICLYTRGELLPTDAVAVAVVGTRRCSHYGREQAQRFGRALGGAGFTVVSGLARGVDGHAHQGALEAGGRTIAVLGQGLGSRVYPPEHEELAARIVQHGAVVSELPVDVIPDSGNFPRRNRIIIGLSLGVVVIEAGARSGALITARLAHDYNREVFALPGRVDCPDVSAGTNGLIRDGKAKLITCLDDVLDELQDVGRIMREAVAATPTSNVGQRGLPGGIAPLPQEPTLFSDSSGVPINRSREVQEPVSMPLQHLEPTEKIVYEAIVRGATELEAIGVACTLDAGRVRSTLTSLELKRLIKRLPGDRFERR